MSICKCHFQYYQVGKFLLICNVLVNVKSDESTTSVMIFFLSKQRVWLKRCSYPRSLDIEYMYMERIVCSDTWFSIMLWLWRVAFNTLCDTTLPVRYVYMISMCNARHLVMLACGRVCSRLLKIAILWWIEFIHHLGSLWAFFFYNKPCSIPM